MPTEADGAARRPTEAYAHEYLIFRSKGYMFISTYLVTDLRCRGLGFHRPDFRQQGLGASCKSC